MATIVKRGKKYSVVYNYTDENGVQRQKWEPPVSTKKEARQRLAEVEYEIQKGTFIVPTCRKVSEFLAEFVEVYGTKKWGLSMYAANTGLIRNYINPILGDVLVQDVDTRAVDRFITKLQRTKAVTVNGRRPKSEYVTPCTIMKINKLMSTAFKQAVRWGMIGKNPFDGAALPHHEEQRRAIWNKETIRKIWIPETLAKLLREWKANQERLKELLGDEYTDYGLVIALENGRPCEDRVLGNAFNRLKKNAGLPNMEERNIKMEQKTEKMP